MEKDLKKSFMQVMFRFKKSVMDFPKILDLTIKELYLLSTLSDEGCGIHQPVDLSEIKGHMHITKAAISQMFTSLEKKGYVVRETDPANRRKITVALTSKGKQVLDLSIAQADKVLDETLDRLGTENAWELISLINQFSDIAGEVKALYLARESSLSDLKNKHTDPKDEDQIKKKGASDHAQA